MSWLVDHLSALCVFEVMTGPCLSLGQAAIELVDRVASDIDQRLVEEGNHEGIPPFLWHLAGKPLEPFPFSVGQEAKKARLGCPERVGLRRYYRMGGTDGE